MGIYWRPYLKPFGVLFLCYLGCALSCGWLYKAVGGFAANEAFLFSFDTIACRGRIPEPTNGFSQWLSIAEAVFGHLLIPLLLAAIVQSIASESPTKPAEAKPKKGRYKADGDGHD